MPASIDLPNFLTTYVIFFTQVSESIEASGGFGGNVWCPLNDFVARISEITQGELNERI
jgi:hypothetical protein